MRIPGIRYIQGRNSYLDPDKRHYGIAIHNTSNDASDENEASYATRRTDGTSSHLYCDHDSVTQSLDLDAKAGHAGSRTGNDHAIAVEITGGNGKTGAWWLANVAWDKLGQVLAWIIRNDPDYTGFQVRRASVAEMKANPKVKAFYGHDDMRRAWGGTDHTDPGPNFPWDRLFAAVNAALGTAPVDTKPQEDDMTDMEKLLLAQARAMAEAALGGVNPAKIPPDLGTSRVDVTNVPAQKIAALEAEVKELKAAATQPVDYRQLAAALLAEIAASK